VEVQSATHIRRRAATEVAALPVSDAVTDQSAAAPASTTGRYTSPPFSQNNALLSAIPASTYACPAACSRTSWVIFIEQNFGPPDEQKGAGDRAARAP
jgi:hypothetical protein